MSQKQRFMLQICQFLTSILSQSLKILRADPSCFGKSQRTSHTPGLMRTPKPHAQFVSVTVPPPSHVTCRSTIKLYCLEVATRAPAAHIYFQSLLEQAGLEPLHVGDKKVQHPITNPLSHKSPKSLIFTRKPDARSGTTGRQLLAIVPGAAIISDNVHAQGTATRGCKILKGTSIVK